MIKNGIKLAADAREIKGYGGLDSIGVAKGSDIKERVSKEMNSREIRSLLAEKADDMMRTTKIDFNDTEDMWWTSSTAADDTNDINMRLNELLNTIKFSRSSNIVLVSHSNLFRALFDRRTHPRLKSSDESVALKAGTVKMNNCAMMRVELDFRLKITDCIVDMQLVFGSSFEDTSPKDEEVMKDKKQFMSQETIEVEMTVGRNRLSETEPIQDTEE
mmetsp:Transcript_2882/g.3301  ORF Transcript_2882/g.3301 Transcript_2882/m.3301 type:complete len:217 (-) Transcript_2882:205-855(-)